MKLPTYLQVEPVGQCNLRCTMCPIQFRKDGPPFGPPAFMTFETFVALVDGFQHLEELHLQGLGEPMLHPRFLDMIDYAATRGIRVTTNSNFTLVSARRIEQLVGSRLDCLHVSVDGATAATYEAIRVRGRFDRLVGNLRRFAEARSRAGRGPRLHLVAVVMRCNLDELAGIVRLGAGVGAEEVFVQHLCHDFAEETLPADYRPMRDYVEQQTLLGESPDRIERAFGEARRVADECKVAVRLPRPRPRPHPPGTPGPQRCDWPWRGAYVSYQGQAMPCCMISTPDRLNFGNLVEQGVEATWNGAGYEAFRRALDSDEPPAVCRSCAVYNGTF